jgi:uncharacterized protein YdeI (YjbR/CyaY-like superfamily)
VSKPQAQPSIPTDFQQALGRAGLLGFFTECAYVHRAGYLGWITTAARPATRQSRIRQAVRRLLEQRAEVLSAASRRCA